MLTQVVYTEWNKTHTLYTAWLLVKKKVKTVIQHDMRCLIFNIHVTVKWGKILLSIIICHDIQVVLGCMHDPQCSEGVSFHRMIMEYLLRELSFSWGTTSCAATQELLSILWNLKDHYCVQKSPPLIPILQQIDAVNAIQSYLSKIHF
jgi:hypothetical protein